MKTQKSNPLSFKTTSIIELSNTEALKVIGGDGVMYYLDTVPTRPTTG